MNKKILMASLLWGLFFIQSCAHKKNMVDGETLDSTGKPVWVDQPSKGCQKGYLCAVGQGVSRSLSKVNSSAGIARLFQSKVSSTFTSELKNDNGVQTSFDAERVEEVTEMALEGVEHFKTWESKTEFFTLARIKKSKLANSYRNELKKIDEEIRGHMEAQGSGSLWKIEKLLKSRDIFNKRLVFLTNFDVSPPISYRELARRKRKLTRGIIVHVYFKDETGDEVKSFLTQTVSEMGYRLQKGKTWKPTSTHLLKGSLKAEKAHLKVKGFVKYKFIFSLESENAKRVKSGAMNITIEETGRSLRQAYDKALIPLKKQIIDNLDKISFRK